MSNLYEDIRDFHVKFRLEYNEPPRELPSDIALFRIGFIAEELAEYAAHSGFTNIARSLNELHEHIKNESRWVIKRNEGGHNLEMQFDSLIDMTYVVLGTAHLHGFLFNEGWRRVHNANMTKVRVDHPLDSTRKSKYDVVKPKGWAPADLSDLVK